MRDETGLAVAVDRTHTCNMVDDSRCTACAADFQRQIEHREALIAAGFASLVEVVDVIRRQGGFLRTEDQQALFRAERIIEQAKVTP